MRLEDIVKQKGLEIKKEETKSKPSSSPSTLGRRYFWDEGEEKTRNKELTEEKTLSTSPVEAPQIKNEIAPETRNKPVIKDEQSTNKELIEPVMETRNTRNKELTGISKTRNVKVIKDEQSTNKPVMENGTLGLEKVSTFQRQILFAIFDEVQANPFDKETRPLNLQQFGKLIKIEETQALESLRIVILRLEKSGILTKTKVKTGRSGWTQYSLPNRIFDEVLKERTIAKPVIKNEQSTNKELTKPVMDSSYSSNLNSFSIKNYNNNEPTEPDFEIPENISALGISQKSLQAIVRDNFLSRDEVDSSLKHYSFDLLKNQVKLKSAQFFMGVLRNKTPYISSHFAQDEAKAVQAELARIKQIQSDRAELAELKLREEFEEYKLKNPNFLEEVKSGNSFLAKSNSKILDEIAFGKFKEKINTDSQSENP